MKAVVKKKKPLLLYKHRKERMDFAIRHKIGLRGTGKGLYSQMRLKSITLGQMAGNGLGKGQERG